MNVPVTPSADTALVETKRCNRCERTLPVSEFYKKGNGYRWVCKPCYRQAMTPEVLRAGADYVEASRAVLC